MRRTMRRQCPHCANYVTWPETPTYPFCSERCRLIDLGVWADGGYRLPGESASAADLQGHTTTSEDEELSAEG